MKIKSKRLFTMMETLITIALLAMISVYVGIHVKDLLRSHQFKQESASLQSKLQLAKELSLSYQTDVEVVFEPTKDGIQFQVKSDEPALKHMSLITQPILFRTFQNIYFLKQPLTCKTNILFSGTGWMFPVGEISVLSKYCKKINVVIDPSFKGE